LCQKRKKQYKAYYTDEHLRENISETLPGWHKCTCTIHWLWANSNRERGKWKGGMKGKEEEMSEEEGQE
jgi:hypothetical protein